MLMHATLVAAVAFPLLLSPAGAGPVVEQPLGAVTAAPMSLQQRGFTIERSGEGVNVRVSTSRRNLLVLVLMIMLFFVALPGVFVWRWLTAEERDMDRSVKAPVDER